MFMVSFLYFYRLDINFKTVKKYGSFYSQLYTDKGKQDKVKIVDVTKRPSKVKHAQKIFIPRVLFTLVNLRYPTSFQA